MAWRQCFYRFLATGIRLAAQTQRYRGVTPACLAEMATNRERVAEMWANFSPSSPNYQPIWDAQAVREPCLGTGSYDADAALVAACPNGRFTMANRGIVRCAAPTNPQPPPPTSPPVPTEVPTPSEPPTAAAPPPPNVVRTKDGTYQPAFGYEWATNDPSSLGVRLKAGLRRTNKGVEPADGYEWVSNDGSSDAVKRKIKRLEDYLAPDDWSEPWLNGSIVRLRNRDSRPIAVMSYRVFDCNNTGKLLCPVSQSAPSDYWLFTIEPGQVQDLVIVPWPEVSGKPMTFRYTYEWRPKP